jgi:hypothetical protein
MRLHEKHCGIEMHVQKIVMPEWLKRNFVFHLFVAGYPKSVWKAFSSTSPAIKQK